MSDVSARALGGAPNSFVAQHATSPDVLPMTRLTLLGVAGPEGAMRALIREASGRIVIVALGEEIGFGRLIEVSPAGVVVELDNGNATFLRPFPWQG